MPHKDTIEEIVKEFELDVWPSKGESLGSNTHMERIKSFLHHALQKSRADGFHAGLQRAEDEKLELIEALEMMYDQYCGNGHEFMTAGENAQTVLQKYGFDTDMAGRITNRPALTKEAENK